ncbi:MAG: ABC transporter permease subunit [Thermoplasmata archaeon]
MKYRRDELLFLIPVLAFVGLFAVLPAADLFATTLSASGGLAGLRAVAVDPLDRLSIENSLLQGGLSAAFAVAIGYPTGLMIGRYRWPGREVVRSLLIVPFLLPSLVVVFGVEDLFGPAGVVSGIVPGLSFFGHGTPGIVAANLLFNVPIVALFTSTGCEGASRELEESVATLGGSPLRAYRDAWGPATWTGAAAGGLLTFLFSALSFAPPLILGGTRYYTVEARIYALDKGTALAPNAAGVLALLMVLLFLPATIAYLVLLGRLRARPGRRRASGRPLPWRTPLGAGLAATTAAVLAVESALWGAVLYRSVRPSGGGPWGGAWGALFSAQTSAKLGIPVAGAIGNTFLFALGASALTLLLGIAAGHAIARRPDRAAWVGLLLFVPLLLSPVVLAFALAQFWRPLLGGEESIWALILISQSVLAIPFAVQSLEIPLAGLPRDAAETARTLGAPPWTAYLDVDLPRVRGGLVTAGLFALALGLGEFTATYFLVTPRFTTVPVALYDLSCCSRSFALSDTLAGLLLILSLATFGALALGGRRVEL